MYWAVPLLKVGQLASSDAYVTKFVVFKRFAVLSNVLDRSTAEHFDTYFMLKVATVFRKTIYHEYCHKFFGQSLAIFSYSISLARYSSRQNLRTHKIFYGHVSVPLFFVGTVRKFTNGRNGLAITLCSVEEQWWPVMWWSRRTERATMVPRLAGTWTVSFAGNVASLWRTLCTSGRPNDSTADVITPKPSVLAASAATRSVEQKKILRQT